MVSARKRCSFEGCNKHVVREGVCVTHGAKVKRCSFKGCTNIIVKGGVCVTHGAKRHVYICTFVGGCTNQAIKGGVCITHGAIKKRCSVEGCTNGVVKGGVCYRHRSKSWSNSNNNPPLQPNTVTPAIPPPHQLINYEDEEGLNSWIWRSTPMTSRRVALNYASGKSSLPPVPAPVVSAPSAYDQETDNDDAFSTHGR
jgi:hypothetical protein